MSKAIDTPKLIAFDVDGCVLNFVEGFKLWMQAHHGLTTDRGEAHVLNHRKFMQDLYPDFNPKPLHDILDDYYRHPIYKQMQPFPYAVEAVRQIKHVFNDVRCIAVSSVPEDEDHIRARQQQLAPFGFDGFTPVGLGQMKADYLRKIGACLLFDDHHEQIEAAEENGIKTILVTRAWNQHHPHPHRLNSWQEAVSAIHNRLINNR